MTVNTSTPAGRHQQPTGPWLITFEGLNPPCCPRLGTLRLRRAEAEENDKRALCTSTAAAANRGELDNDRAGQAGAAHAAT